MRVLLTLSLVALPLGPLQAQRQATGSTNWITLGLGQATWGGLTEIGGQFTVSHQSRRILMTGRAVVGFDIIGGALATQGTVTDVQDFAATVGVGSRPGLVRYSVGTGVAIATITRQGASSGSDTKTSAVGLPLEGQIFVQPLRFLGIGVYGYGDLNKEKSFWGWSISVALGRLR